MLRIRSKHVAYEQTIQDSNGKVHFIEPLLRTLQRNRIDFLQNAADGVGFPALEADGPDDRSLEFILCGFTDFAGGWFFMFILEEVFAKSEPRFAEGVFVADRIHVRGRRLLPRRLRLKPDEVELDGDQQ